MSFPRCSVVIRGYNEEKHLPRLLTGILQQTVKDVEILLVDSGSTDATIAVASRFPARILSIAPEDFSFGKSLNIGCAAAKGEFIVIASAHVYPVYPDWLEQLLRPFEDKEVAVVYGKQRGGESTRFSERQHFAKMYPVDSRARQDNPVCNNANAAIRRSLWVKRKYNEELPGLEDLEWATWALSEGHAISYSAEAEVIHVHEETPRKVYNRYRREAIGLKRIQPAERFGIGDFIKLYLSNVASDALHALQQRILLREAWGIGWFRLMQFWGTYRGFSAIEPKTSQFKEAFFYPRERFSNSLGATRDLPAINYGGLGTHHSSKTEESLSDVAGEGGLE